MAPTGGSSSEPPSLAGRRYICTNACEGANLARVRELLRHGAAVVLTGPTAAQAEAAAAALRAFGPKLLKKEIKDRGLQERSEGMVEKAELVALLLEDGWRPPQESSDDETDDEERTRLC